jgi:hypothetical protein
LRPPRVTKIAAIRSKQPEASHNSVQHSANPYEMRAASPAQIAFQDEAPQATAQTQDAALSAGVQESSSSNGTAAGPAAKLVGRQQTEPFSVTSVNSEIRIADNTHKADPVRALKDVADIPGKEILWFDPESGPSGRWRSSPKEDVARQESCGLPFHNASSRLLTIKIVREGVLWVLPRGFSREYRTSQGFFHPWKELSFTKNMKRIFGHSMRTMFIKGRYTQEQLENAMGRKVDSADNMD